MQFKIFNHGKSCHADGIYEDGKVTVFKGSKLFIDCNNKFDRYTEALSLRTNKDVVGIDGVLLQDCTFKTPSAAAVFVAGSSRSGNTFWRVEPRVSLETYLDREGISHRTRKKA